MLLDEPTAHLDPDTERVIAETVRDLGRRSAVVVVAHRPALVALADRVVTLPVPEPVVPVRPATTAARPAPPEEPVDERRHGLALPTVLGGLASASGVALTATAGWLIVEASYQPPILTLLVAIVAVRTFGIARPVLRYAERLRSHDVVLRMLAQRRVEVYDAVVPLTPGALGRRRGDLLAAVVDDVDSVLDRELRVRMPVRGFADHGGARCRVRGADRLAGGAGRARRGVPRAAWATRSPGPARRVPSGRASRPGPGSPRPSSRRPRPRAS